MAHGPAGHLLIIELVTSVASPNATATPATINATVTAPAATVTGSAVKTLYNFDFNIEAKLFDDLAVNWDDPDSAVHATATPAAIAAVVTLPAATLTATSTMVVAAPIAATVTMPAVTATGGGGGGGTFVMGDNTIKGNSALSDQSWNPECLVHSSYRYTASTGDVVTQVAAYGDDTGLCEMTVYVFSGGVPTTRAFTPVTVNIGSSPGWYTTTVSWALTAGVTYVVAMDYWTGASWNIRYGAGPGGTATSADYTTGSVPFFPATWTQSATNTDNASFYATVTSSGSTNATATPAAIAAVVSLPSATATGGGGGGGNVTDDFNRANGAIGSNWSIPTGSTAPQIVSNQLVASASSEYAARWSADDFEDDQFAQVVATVSGFYGGVNLEVRTTDSASQPFYGLFYSDENGGQLRLYYYNGADNNLDVATGLGAGTAHTIKLEVIGTSLTGYFDGSPVVSGTNSALTSGRVGIYLSRFGSSVATIDDFSAGPTVGGSGDATATPAVIAALVTLPAPTVTAGGSATATPATISVLVSMPQVTLPLAFAYPVSISGRKLLDQFSAPFLLPTMSSWGMSSQLSNADITTYLGQVAANHFKGVTIFIGGGYNIGTGWNTYTNQAGNQYWATTAGGNTSATPWACGVGSAGTQLGAAWSTFDHIVTETARLGLVLTAAFCGGFGDTGASDDWEAATNTQMYNAGVKIATRYLGTAPHMIWELMLDNASITPASTRGTRIQNLMSGINDTEGTGARPVRWLETGGGGNSTNDAGWFGTGFFNATINCIYTYSSNSVEEFENGWAETTAPTGDCEPPYVGSSYYSGDGHQKTRERNYAIFLEGGCLINFGHEDWWPFGAAQIFSEGLTPATVMASSSLQEAKYCWDFIDAYVKDSSWAPSSFVTTGQGSGATKASAGASNSRAAAYFPNSRSITVDTTAIPGGGNVRLRWFDPSNNSYTTINAGEAKNASRNVTHPGNGSNSVGQSDYVLIVDEVGDAVATPATISVVVSMPTPVASVSLTRSVAAPIAAVVTMPLVTASGTGTATPAPIAAVVTMPTPTVTATATKLIAAPISAVVTMPTPTFSLGASTSPAPIAAVVSMPTPLAKADVTRSVAAPVNAVVTMPTPTVKADVTRSVAAPIAATVTLPTPTFSLGGSAAPAPIAAAVTMPSPTFSLGASLTTTPILAPVTMPLVNATGTAAGVTAPSPIFTAVAMPTPTVSASVTTTPATIAVTATPTPTWEIWDDFNRASIGADWGAITGLSTMAIVSNTSVRPSASVTHCGNKHVTSLALSDHIVEADFNIATSTTANSIMLLMRMPSGTTNTGYYVSVPRDSTVNREIGKIVNGTFTVLAAEADGTWTGTRRIRGQVKGNTIKLFIDGVEEMSVVDSEIATGTYVGIRGHLTPLTSWTLDNFLARSLPVQNANVIPAGGWIIADVSMPTPTKTVGGTRSPAPISVLATLPTPTLLATGLIIPAPIAAAVSMPAVTAVATSAGTTAPAPIFSAVTMPTPTFSLGASTVPAPIAAAVTTPAATVSGGTGATTAPVPIAAAVTLPSPTLQVSASTAPSPIAAAVSIPAVTATGTAGTTAAPATISAVVTVNIPSLTAGGQAAPNPVLAAVTLPTPISQPESTTSPAPITVLVTFPTPTLTTSSQAAPATILARVTMPTVSLPGAILPPQVTVDLEVLVPDVTLTTFVPNVTLTLL